MRLEPLAGPDRILVITAAQTTELVSRDLPVLPPGNLLTEPAGRDSLPAIALAAAVIEHRYGDAVMGSFAADHLISDDAEFADAVKRAYSAAQDGFVATIGIAPAGPSTAYGYIERGEPLGGQSFTNVYRVRSFREKPDLATAVSYFADGRYFWNAGIFVFKVRQFLGHLQRLRPDVAEVIGRLADRLADEGSNAICAASDAGSTSASGAATALAAPVGEQWPPDLMRVWEKLPRVAIDHAIAEPLAAEGGLAVAPGRFSWSDIGDYASLADHLTARTDGSLVAEMVAGPPPIVRDSPGSLVVSAAGRRIALLGLTDVVVVDTPEAVLVLDRSRAQDVKAIAEAVGVAHEADATTPLLSTEAGQL
jgi:mannose-1-phosphate guanylyltransferase